MNAIESFSRILQEGVVRSVFQPIVSLKDGSIFAYEGLSRVFVESMPVNIEKAFELAKKENRLWDFEVLCRSKVLENARKKPMHAKLFINVDANVMKDPEMKTGFTYNKLCEIGFDAEQIVFEITEKSAIESLKEFSDTIEHYRNQKYFIAVDDYGSGYSGLNRVCAFSPDFIKIDMDLVRDIDKDTIKKSVVAATVSFCRESGIKVIAEGIETFDELKTLVRLGVDYGQGYFLAKPDYEFVDITYDAKLQIIKLYQKYQMQNMPSIFSKIKQLSKFRIVFSSEMSLEKAYELMQLNIGVCEVFVIDKNNCVVGKVSKSFLKAHIDCTTNTDKVKLSDILSEKFAIIDCDTSIEKAVNIAMQRELEHLYEAIAITKNGRYIGSVSIKDLLLAVVRFQKYNYKIA